MTSIALALGAFCLCLFGGSRSLKLGICAIIGIGYAYGIVRANLPDVYIYLMFDAGAIGLYLSQLWRPMTPAQRRGSEELRLWVAALVGWPVLLFILFPTNAPLVEAVGLRANVFLLPFLLLGARLTTDDLKEGAVYIAVLNLAAVGLGVAEYFLGIAPFFPQNDVTDIIYKSHDLLERTAYRIPSSFSSAHAFAGTLAVTLPLLVGAWSQEQHRRRSRRALLLGLSIIASFLGIFMAAARVHMITAALIALVVTFGGRLSQRQWVRWALALAVVGYVVSGNARLQRFTTLADRAGVTERIGTSVNETFFDIISIHPLGRGLAGGGTSVPYFLRGSQQSGLVIENEYARIALEQGVPGLIIWVGFMAWVLMKGTGQVRDEWWLARRLVWVVAASNFLMGVLGIGMLAAVPSTSLMLMLIGWMATTRRAAFGTVALSRTEPAA